MSRSRRGFAAWSVRASWRGWSARPAPTPDAGWRSPTRFLESSRRRRSAAEIAWALAREEEGGRPARIVLLAGRPLELMRRHRRLFHFDQGGVLAARLRIAATPSLVGQAGTLLRITEIPVADRDGPGPDAGEDPTQIEEK